MTTTKKLTILTVLTLVFGAISAPKAQAQNYAHRVLSVCPVCHTNVYAQLRPVVNHGRVSYVWVPVYHTACAARVAQQRSAVHYHSSRSHSIHSRSRHSSIRSRVPYRTTTCSPRYSGYVRPGFSITIRR